MIVYNGPYSIRRGGWPALGQVPDQPPILPPGTPAAPAVPAPDAMVAPAPAIFMGMPARSVLIGVGVLAGLLILSGAIGD